MKRLSHGLVIFGTALLLVLTFVAGERRDIVRTIASSGASKGLPDAAYDPATGRYLVVWQEWSGRTADDWDVRGRILDKEGAALGGPIDLASTSRSEKHPKVAASGDGFWRVVWSTGSAIEACSVGPDGGVERRVEPIAASEGTLAHPDIQGTAGGGFFVVWEETDPPGLAAIKGAWIDRYAGETTTERTVAASRSHALKRPALAVATGGFFVAWEKHINEARIDIEGRFVDASPIAFEEQPGDILTIAADGALNSNPDVAGISDTGSVAAVWTRGKAQEPTDIMYATIDGTGAILIGAVTATGDRSESQPSLSYFGPGRPLLVTYRSSPAGRPGESSIFARALGRGLAPVSLEAPIDGGFESRSGHPSVAWAVGDQGRGLVVWDTHEGAGMSLYSRDLQASELPGVPPVVSIASPLEGQEVSETVEIQAVVDDVDMVARVEFFVDGERLGQDAEAPFSWTWDTASVPNGTHTVGAKATNSSGLTGEDQVSVTVRNMIIALDDHTISGTVIFNGAALANVLMSGFPGDPRTDASGAYAAGVPTGWSGTVTPTLPGFTFSPAFRAYSDVSGDLAAEDYSATFVGGVDDAYEDNDAFAAAAILPLGTTQDLVLNDADWFKFHVPAEDAGKDLKVRLWGTAFPDTTYGKDLDFGILDSAGTLLTFSLSSNSDETAYVCDAAEGWYYIAHTYIGVEGTVYAVTIELSDAFGLSYISGHVTDDLGTPIEGVTVELYGVPFDWNVSRPLVITDASGFYKIGCAPGDYQVWFNLTDFDDTEDWTPDANYLREMFNYGEVLNIAPGTTTGNIDAALMPGGVLAGRITDGAGSPLDRAIVNIYSSTFARESYAFTDANGDYEINRLRPGNFAVRTRTPTGTSMINEFYDDVAAFAFAHPVGAAAGATTSGIDARLENKPWNCGSISGRVTDNEENPVANLIVTVYDPVGLALWSARTGSDGTYSRGQIPAGSWKILFNAASVSDVNLVSEYYPDKRRIVEAGTVTVTAGQNTAGVDAALAAAGSITGQVFNNGGALSIVAFDTASEFALSVSPAVTAYGQTYTIKNLPPGAYKVMARPYQQVDRMARWYPDSATYDGGSAITVVAGATNSGVDITLSGGGGSISGRVTDDLGSGIPGVSVVAQDASKATGYSSALTDADGNYLIRQVPAGQVKVFFNAEAAWLGYAYEYFNDQSGHGAGSPVTVTEGEMTAGIDAVLAARPALTVTTMSLAAGELAVPYSAALEAAGGRTFYGWSILSGALPEGLTMNSRGEITGTPTVPGTYPLTVQVTDSTSPQQSVTQELSLTIGAYSGPGYTITGYVTSGGSPVPGVVLSGLPDSPVTNLAGGYAAVVPSGWSGTATPTLAAHAFDPPSRSYGNVSASSAGQDYSATPGHTISGTVTFNGEPQPNVLMAGLPGDPNTDASGIYSAAVPAGWTGTVTPTLAGFTFSPADRAYTDVSANATAQDYAASYAGGIDDAFEDNDDFDSAAILPLGTTPGLVLRDEDWFKVYVPASEAGKDLRVRLWGTAYPDTTTRRDLDFYVLDGAGNALSANISGSADETAYICDVSEGWYYIAHTYVGLEGTVYSLSAETNADFGLGYITGTIRDDDGYVIQGVAVELYGMPFNWDVSRPLIYTDASGRYKIGYTPGLYTLQLNVNVNNDDLDWTPEANYLGKTYNGGEVLNVVAGATLSDINANLIPGGTITGRITDAAGNPLSMALAYAYAGDTVRASYDFTDANGYYRMWRLRTGNYAVRFRSPGGYPLATEWYQDGATFDSALPVPVTAGEITANIDASLVEGGGISGQVMNHLGEPLAKVQVTAYDEPGIALQAGSTNEAGVYYIGRLPAGTYRVQFNASTSGDPTAASEYYPGKRLLAEAEGVLVTVGGTTTGINAQLALGGAIFGQVTDEAGNPLIGVGVHALDIDSDFYALATTNSWGGYAISNLAADQYKVRFRPSPGYWATEWWDDTSSFTESDTVTVGPGDSIAGINAALSTEFGTITGRVTDGFGAGIEGLLVLAQDVAKEAAYSTAVTNADGYYSLLSLPTCQAKVRFNADAAYLNYLSEYYADKGGHGSADAIAVTAGSTTSGIDAVLAARPALAVETGSLPAGELAVGYSSTLAASGGRTLYHWSLESGALPDGLSMNERGEITGVPTDQGTFVFTVRVKDSTWPQQAATRELSITIGPYTGVGYTISGTITLDNAPLPGVVLSGLPGDPATNSLGGYAAVVPPDWTGTVKPTLAGHVFSPPVRSYADVSSEMTGQDYAASPGYYILGSVTHDGMGLADVMLAGLPGDPLTNLVGAYICGVPIGWSGTVTPALEGFVFTPSERTYADVNGDLTDQDYVAADIVLKDDLLGTWDGQGVYYRNSDTGAWVKLASPADMITTGDLDGDGVDDLVGLWSGQGGIWVKYSTTGTWVRLSSTARYIGTGDMNGDGRADLIGTWHGQGVFYRNSITGAWVKMASEATMITSGDIDGDGTDDLLGLWPAQGGIWVKYSSTGAWARLSSTAVHIGAGDMNGDGRDDLLGTWDGQGVFYRDSMTGAWVKMASPATLITAGDIDGDGTDDLIGIWPTQGGVWVKSSSTGSWALLSSTARDIAAGKMRPASLPAPSGELNAEVSAQAAIELPFPMGGFEEGPAAAPSKKDLSMDAPGGWRFYFKEETNLVPKEDGQAGRMRIPGPGEQGFAAKDQKNLYPDSGAPDRRVARPIKKK